MAKISSSQPPRNSPAGPGKRPRAQDGSQKSQRSQKGSKHSDARHWEEEGEVNEPGAGDGILTMGERLALEQELSEQTDPYAAALSYEDEHEAREDKERADAARESEERVHQKDHAGLRSGDKQDARHHRGKTQTAQATAQQKQLQQELEGLKQKVGEKVSDGFEMRQAEPVVLKQKPAVAPAAPIVPPAPPRAPPSRMGGGGAIAALNDAKDPGVYFREDEADLGGRADDEDEDPELAAAVEEAIRLLFGVRGIYRICAGTNDVDEKVIIIEVTRGFTHRSMSAIPERVHAFRTLVALPYELLPLRRDIL